MFISHTHTHYSSQVPNVGPGPTFECVQFGITGKSPLFQHHLRVHQLTEVDGPRGPFISRTQIKEIPYPYIQRINLSNISIACVLDINIACVLDISIACVLDINIACVLDITIARVLDINIALTLSAVHQL